MRLIQALRLLAEGKEGTPQPQASSGAFFDKGLIESVGGTGLLMVKVNGQSVDAKPVTDEPFKKDQYVWVSRSTEGWIVHGGVR